ncbi:MAG: thioredoxin family protein [Alphaproteobacteria bacterium]
MALVSTLPLSTESLFSAPDFSLKNIDGQTYSLTQLHGTNGLVVGFICNHCPYVKAIIHNLVADFGKLQQHGFGVVAIMPNDTLQYPEDSFEKMAVFAQQHHFTFPYLIDSDQSVAKAYGAVCTPEFYGFDKKLNLQYKGRLDASSPSLPLALGEGKRELLDAMLLINDNGVAPSQQLPSMGCSIKWQK